MKFDDEIDISQDHIIKLYKMYGHNMLLCISIEELSELTKEITKYHRGKDNLDAMAEEMAHVLICIDELAHMLGIPKWKIQAEIDRKYAQFKEEEITNEVPHPNATGKTGS